MCHISLHSLPFLASLPSLPSPCFKPNATPIYHPQYNCLPLKVTRTSGNLGCTSETACQLLPIFITKVSKFFSPFLERVEWLSFAPTLCSVWVLVLRSRGRLCSCLVHNQVLIGCFSLFGWSSLFFISGNPSSEGEGTRRRSGTFGKYLVDMSHFKSNDLPICYLFPWSLLGLRTAGKQPSSLREYLCHSSLSVMQDKQVVREMFCTLAVSPFFSSSCHFLPRLHSKAYRVSSSFKTQLKHRLLGKPSQPSFMWSPLSSGLSQHCVPLSYGTSHMVT